jgi:uncharacterized caspase-like protein
MRRALRDFSAEVRDADIAIIYCAGHGIEIEGKGGQFVLHVKALHRDRYDGHNGLKSDMAPCPKVS